MKGPRRVSGSKPPAQKKRRLSSAATKKSSGKVPRRRASGKVPKRSSGKAARRRSGKAPTRGQKGNTLLSRLVTKALHNKTSIATLEAYVSQQILSATGRSPTKTFATVEHIVCTPQGCVRRRSGPYNLRP